MRVQTQSFIFLIRKKIMWLKGLTTVTAIWRFDAIAHAAIHQTRPDKFLTRFNTQCAYSET